MGIYAALGVSQSLTMFVMGASFAILTYYASKRLHEVCLCLFVYKYLLTHLEAITRVLHAPMSFFEFL